MSFLDSSLKRVAANNHRRTSTTSSRKPSLAFGDTPDCLRDLGHLELISRELDPSGQAQLNRSMSTDSLSSISSIANNFGHDFTVGQLEVTLEFEPSRHPGHGAGVLHITLHQGKDLLEREEGDFPGCFIRVSLGPDEISVGVTRVRKSSCACGRMLLCSTNRQEDFIKLTLKVSMNQLQMFCKQRHKWGLKE